MGWKSTKEISRIKAIELLSERIYSASDEELSNALESLGFGEESFLPYYGYNFCVTDELIENDEEDDDC